MTRFSADRLDPGWANYVEILAAGRDLSIYLDGEKVENAVTADDVEGFVLVQVIPPGNVLPAGQELQHERRTGKVGFKVVDRNGTP